MKGHALLILSIVVVALVPLYYINRALVKAIRPRETAGRFFLFIFANFLLIVVYTMTVVAIVVRMFPAR
ncbi:MAG TPA: hypothetical protein VHC48_07625 [Puia sp.]|nr:hypothetical protein [Puia sp.]